jgi:hypothetical protein
MIHAMKKHSSCFDVTDADSGRWLEKSLHELPNMHKRHVEIKLPPEYVWIPNQQTPVNRRRTTKKYDPYMPITERR